MSIDGGVIVAGRSVLDLQVEMRTLRLVAAWLLSIYWEHNQIHGRQERLYFSRMGRLNTSREMALMVCFRNVIDETLMTNIIFNNSLIVQYPSLHTFFPCQSNVKE